MPDPTLPPGARLPDPHAEAERIRRLPPIALPVERSRIEHHGDGIASLGPELRLEEPCPDCHGRGGYEDDACPSCEGAGVRITEAGGMLLDFLRRHDPDYPTLPARTSNRDRARQMLTDAGLGLMAGYAPSGPGQQGLRRPHPRSAA